LALFGNFWNNVLQTAVAKCFCVVTGVLLIYLIELAR
jgi:hypothetical protein